MERDDARPGTEPPSLLKPRLRGRLHQAAFLAAVPATVVLVLHAGSGVARVAAGVYGASLVGLFATSAAYHRRAWTARALPRMRRLDHAMIYVLIAGTYTPFSLLVLRPPWSTVILLLVWVGAGVGILIQAFAFDRLRVLGLTLYGVLGWLALPAAPAIAGRLTGSPLALLLAGGLLYSGGAFVLLFRKPDPSPRVFGYHEVFHLATVVAGACHYASILQVVRSIA